MGKKLLMTVSAVVALAGIIVIVIVFGSSIIGKNNGFGYDKAVSGDTLASTSEVTGQSINNSESSKAAETQGSDNFSDTTPAETGNDSSTDNSDKNNGNSGKGKIKVKAIYLSGMSAGTDKILDHYIDIINKTELNAVVIDVKEAGVVNYKSAVPLVVEKKLYANNFNPEKVIKKLHDNNIYVIARIVCFRDNGLATKVPELAVKRPDGSIWTEGKQGAWTNAYNEKVWQYNIDIAKEAVEKGFDEIQFDYVRFPTASSKNVYYGSDAAPKTEAIAGFLKKAKEELHDGFGVPVSADVFGIIAESPKDAKSIGQQLDKIVTSLDYISPMVYPSHYSNAAKKGFLANGQGQSINGVNFTAPDLKPYEVVYNTLLGIKKVIDPLEGEKADVRPYLQDFTASYLPNGYYQDYGAEEVKQQIKAVYDAGYEQWILWDGKNKYSEGAFADN